MTTMLSRLVVLILATTSLTLAQGRASRPLAAKDIDDLATLLMLEDTRRLDPAALTPILASTHAEVRRRAVVAIGRIADPRGGELLMTARRDPDVEVQASVAFAQGQLKDPAAVAWLSETLLSPQTPPAVAREAARALGKIQIPESHAALARYLTTAAATKATAPVVGEALLSIGRFNGPQDLTPLVKWMSSADPEVRWRATWALFRPRDPAALPHLITLSTDASAEVRFWAVRGLGPSPATAGAFGAAAAAAPSEGDRARATTRLREAVRDPDRRVRTEALRALAQLGDDESFAAVLTALESDDSWLAVSAAEGLARYTRRASDSAPKLLAATGPSRSLAVRVTALTSLAAIAPEQGLDAAVALARIDNPAARTAARQALGRMGPTGNDRVTALVAEGVLPAPATTRPARVSPTPKTLPEYRRLVERWIVPDYTGRPKPRAIWETPRGAIEIELYPGDAPMGVDYFVTMVESRAIVGTEFTRVVPNFVAQQRAIREDAALRDEVNRHGLTRGNLSWASAGLDTGRPGYTLGNTPQPHNEGNFTALGRVVSGMEAVDRLELGDRITAARLTR